MGVAEVIPGVSGGTVALITGVLGRLVEAIHSLDAGAVRHALSLRVRAFLGRVHWRFLLMLFSGQILGIVLCTKVISLPHLLRVHPEPLLGLFFGLILGSIILLARQGGRPGWAGLSCYLLGLAVGAAVVAGVRTETPEAPLFVGLCGVISICAWILPGISGSFVLLLLKKYDYIWLGVTLGNGKSLVWNLTQIVLPFGIGAVAGLVCFSRVLSWMMSRFPERTTMAMNGLLIASLYAIFPFQDRIFETTAGGKEKLVGTAPYFPGWDVLTDGTGALSVGLIFSGAGLVLGLDLLARRRHRGEVGQAERSRPPAG